MANVSNAIPALPTTTEPEIVRLRNQVDILTQENAFLKGQMGGTTDPPTTALPTVLVHGIKVAEKTWEYGMLAGVITLTILLWVLPLLKPIRRHIESRLFRIMPIITLLNLFILAVALSALDFVAFNDLFFGFVKVLEVGINVTQKALLAAAALAALLLMWKFKDRLLEALGVDNPAMLIGGFRDWATCWSMKRFVPIELFIWKVEGLPSLHLHQANDIYVEVNCGYNNQMLTRVHLRAGHSCSLKESMQMNFDVFDLDTRLYITVKNQDVLGASEIASVQLSAAQVSRNLEPKELNPVDRTLGWGTTNGAEETSAWAESRFKAIELVPAGTIYLRFQPVVDEDGAAPSYGKLGSSW
jgi:hypothetical protein